MSWTISIDFDFNTKMNSKSFFKTKRRFLKLFLIVLSILIYFLMLMMLFIFSSEHKRKTGKLIYQSLLMFSSHQPGSRPLGALVPNSLHDFGWSVSLIWQVRNTVLSFLFMDLVSWILFKLFRRIKREFALDIQFI